MKLTANISGTCPHCSLCDEVFEAGSRSLHINQSCFAFAKRISTSARALLSSQVEDQMNLLLHKIINYAERKSDEGWYRVAKYQAYVANATSAYTQVGEATSGLLQSLHPAESVEKFMQRFQLLSSIVASSTRS